MFFSNHVRCCTSDVSTLRDSVSGRQTRHMGEFALQGKKMSPSVNFHRNKRGAGQDCSQCHSLICSLGTKTSFLLFFLTVPRDRIDPQEKEKFLNGAKATWNHQGVNCESSFLLILRKNTTVAMMKPGLFTYVNVTLKCINCLCCSVCWCVCVCVFLSVMNVGRSGTMWPVGRHRDQLPPPLSLLCGSGDGRWLVTVLKWGEAISSFPFCALHDAPSSKSLEDKCWKRKWRGR